MTVEQLINALIALPPTHKNARIRISVWKPVNINETPPPSPSSDVETEDLIETNLEYVIADDTDRVVLTNFVL